MNDENNIEDAVILNEEEGGEIQSLNLEDQNIETSMQHGMNKLFLAGPMTGIEDKNYPLFNRVTAEFRNVDFQVCTPTEFFDGKTDRERKEYMSESIKWLVQADTIVLLPGWEKSPGAYLLASIAKELELICVEYAENDEDVPLIGEGVDVDGPQVLEGLGEIAPAQQFLGSFTPVEVDEDGKEIVSETP
jgi:Domain of unknown function (DUF4406)